MFSLLLLAAGLAIVVVSLICYAAYKIDAESFEFSTTILKLASFSIKIMSPGKRRQDEPGSQVEKHSL